MFESKTVFIVGAGASEEAGLPIGSGLTEKIANLINLKMSYGDLESGDPDIYHALTQLVNKAPAQNRNTLLASARSVTEAMDLALSIDTFLESHATNEEYVLVGKLGIVRAIVIEERKSLLTPDYENGKPFHLKRLSKTWYYSLARQLFTGIPVENPELSFQNVSFVVFNYDRCLQTFLIRALEVYFRITLQRAEEIVKNIRIIHPYGSLGSILPGLGQVPFAPRSLDILEAAARIKTFSESAESGAVATAKSWVEESETLIFLGFGFHDQNMELLDPGNTYLHDENDQRRFRAFATAYDLSDSDAEIVRDQISFLRSGMPDDNAHQRIYTNNGKCADLFRTYWRSLTR